MVRCGLWPSGKWGTGSIPARHNDKSQHRILSGSAEIGIKTYKEVLMKDKTEISHSTKTILKVEFIVATIITCLLAAPMTKDHKHGL